MSEKNIDRESFAETIEVVCDAVVKLLRKDDYNKADHFKIRVLRVSISIIESGIELLELEILEKKLLR